MQRGKSKVLALFIAKNSTLRRKDKQQMKKKGGGRDNSEAPLAQVFLLHVDKKKWNVAP